MDIWERLFKKRRAADAAFHPFVGAVEERVRTPKGPRKSAEGGAQIRAELWAIIEGVEAKTGRHAFGFAGEDQVIMTSEALEVAIGANHESKLLRSGFSCMFMTPQTKASLLDYWSSAVDGFEGKPNTRHLLREKAALLATFVLHHYDIPCLAADPAISPTALEDDTINQLKLEAVAAWYRIIDELAYRFIRSDRDLFCDYLQDSLANLLALQGSSVVSILDHSYERSGDPRSCRAFSRGAREGTGSGTSHREAGIRQLVSWHANLSICVAPGFFLELATFHMAGFDKFIGGRPVNLQKLSATAVHDRQIITFQCTQRNRQLVPDEGRGV